MSLKEWASNGWLRPHQTSPKEIQDLLAIVKRDLTDAKGNISADWQFGIAYNARAETLHRAGLCLRLPVGKHREGVDGVDTVDGPSPRAWGTSTVAGQK